MLTKFFSRAVCLKVLMNTKTSSTPIPITTKREIMFNIPIVSISVMVCVCVYTSERGGLYNNIGRETTCDG